MHHARDTHNYLKQCHMTSKQTNILSIGRLSTMAINQSFVYLPVVGFGNVCMREVEKGARVSVLVQTRELAFNDNTARKQWIRS